MGLKINLGCGNDVRQGHVNVDHVPAPGVDVVADLNKPLPWEDGTVDEVLASHILEHLENPVAMMKEIHRILKKGGLAEIRVPHRAHSQAYSIYHRHYLDEHSFDDLCRTGSSAEYSAMFEILEKRVYWQHSILSTWHMKKYLLIDTSRWPWGTPREVILRLRKIRWLVLLPGNPNIVSTLFELRYQGAVSALKKWFMLQLWRLQQVAQILTIAMLAITLSLQLYNFMNWRGSVFETPYTGVPVLLLILAVIIWSFAVMWDLRLKMWREQATVLIEKNPYAKEKLYSKEIAIYELFWLPVLESVGKDNPRAKASAEALREWLKKAKVQDPNTSKDLEDILDYIGMKDGTSSRTKKS